LCRFEHLCLIHAVLTGVGVCTDKPHSSIPTELNCAALVRPRRTLSQIPTLIITPVYYDYYDYGMMEVPGMEPAPEMMP
jgi:hypothetical protein